MIKICIVDNCCKNVHGNGYCSSHYNRLKRYGDPLGFKERPKATVRRYKTITTDHFLGPKIRLARFILYEKLNGQPANCYWCDKNLIWTLGRESRLNSNAVCADHLDENMLNDSPKNIVPSCRDCNGNRNRWVTSKLLERLA